jgi:hypothetical protein
MDKMSNYLKSLMAKPWILETLFFWGVLWQESFRLSSRTSQRVLLIGSGLQEFYYYHFGDFVNGYVIAYMFDGLVNLFLFRKMEREIELPRTSVFRISRRTLTLFAALFSCTIITIFELGVTSLSTTSGIYDIPAGILGALIYCAVRLFALRFIYAQPDSAKLQ